MSLLVCLRNSHQVQSLLGRRHHVSFYPSLDHRTHTWKKGISDSFQTSALSKVLACVHIFSFTIMTYLKNLTGVKYFNTKQCPAGFSLRIMPSFPASSKMYPPSYQNTATKIKRLIHFFPLKLVDVSSFTKGNPQNYCEIRKQHHIIKFKS